MSLCTRMRSGKSVCRLWPGRPPNGGPPGTLGPRRPPRFSTARSTLIWLPSTWIPFRLVTALKRTKSFKIRPSRGYSIFDISKPHYKTKTNRHDGIDLEVISSEQIKSVIFLPVFDKLLFLKIDSNFFTRKDIKNYVFDAVINLNRYFQKSITGHLAHIIISAIYILTSFS